MTYVQENKKDAEYYKVKEVDRRKSHVFDGQP